MKKQVLTQKISALILMTLLFGLHTTRAMAHGDLEFTEGESATREIAENTAAGTNIGEPLRYTIGEIFDCVRISLSGPDAQAFDVVRVYKGAQLRTKSALNYENKDTYEVRVTAVGQIFLYDRDTITVTISVTNVNEAPFFSQETDEVVNLVHRSIPENTPVGINVGKPVSAIDPDGSNVILIYNISGTNADMFKIDHETGQLRTKMPLDYEAFESDPRTYFVEVEVSDGRGCAKTGVQIEVLPVNEFAPMFIEGETTTREIHEREEIGVNIGAPLTATDMDAGETLEYSLSDTDETFGIDSMTGQLHTKAKLDYESKPVYTVKVVVSDGSREDSILVTIQVLTEFVEIPDFSLAWSIRKELGLRAGAGITKKNMLALTTLHEHIFHPLPVPRIKDLTGLEHATNLTKFECVGNVVADLTPIAGLTKLTSLWLTGNAISSLTPLSGLTNLKRLNLAANKISDITPLKNLTNLTFLHLWTNNIRDLTPLKDLRNLTELSLSGNDIEDVTALSGLTKLRILHLDNNRGLKDVSPLAGLVNLEILGLGGCPIEIGIDGSVGSAPAENVKAVDFLLNPSVLKKLDRKELQVLLRRISVESDGSLKYQQVIALIEKMLASKRPNKTVLLANYPNPFNPETWIPYHLANASYVEVTIFDMRGTAVRHLDLGHQQAGYHTNRNEAAYWDGKNDFGKRVASGAYFYQLQADNVSPMRKMVILK